MSDQTLPPNVKLPGESDPEFGKAVNDYLKDFGARIHIRSDVDVAWNREVYEWCEQHMGTKYKDWFMIRQGTAKSNAIWIKSPKRATFFRLKWNEIIADSVDNPIK
jgi:hypothetical protein